MNHPTQLLRQALARHGYDLPLKSLDQALTEAGVTLERKPGNATADAHLQEHARLSGFVS